MRSRFTLTEAARYLGISTSKLSRHLPADRARRGSPAALTADEIAAVGAELGGDSRTVRERLQAAIGIDPALPDHIRAWAERAALSGRMANLEAYNARIPTDLLDRPARDVDEAPHEPWDASVPLMNEAQMARWLDGEE